MVPARGGGERGGMGGREGGGAMPANISNTIVPAAACISGFTLFLCKIGNYLPANEEGEQCNILINENNI